MGTVGVLKTQLSPYKLGGKVYGVEVKVVIGIVSVAEGQEICK